MKSRTVLTVRSITCPSTHTQQRLSDFTDTSTSVSTTSLPRKPRTMKTLLFRKMNIAGLYFRGPEVQQLVAALELGAALTLAPEPTNPHDSLAVALFHGDVHIGYVPATVNPMVSAMLANKQPISVEYAGMDKKTGLFNLFLDN